jgi:adhesin/invasin
VPTRLLPALLLITLTACIEGSPPVNVGEIQRGPDAARSTVVVEPDTGIAADGQSTAQVRVTVRDRNGNGLAGQEVLFEATGSDNILVQPRVTDASGLATGTIASTRAETKRLTVDVGPADKRLRLPQQPEVTFVPANVARLVFLSQPPASARAGQAFAPPVRVQLLDAQGNAVTAAVNVTLSVVATNGATLSGTVTRAAAAGVAAFDDLNVEKAGTGYTLRAAVGAVSATSSAFDITADTQSPLDITVVSDKNSVRADNTDAATITVTVRDRFGNPVAGQTVGLSASGSNNTLSASSGTTGADGAFSATLRSTRAEVKTVDATVNGTAAAQRPSVTFTAGNAASLAFVTQPPASITAGQTMFPAVSVELLDAQGNRVMGFAGTVTMTLVAANGATLEGTATQAAVAGLASFGDLSVQRAGIGYQLRASIGGPIEALSSAFDVVADTVSPLVRTVQVSKSTVTADNSDTTTITVTVVDRFNNPVAGQAVGLAVTGSNNTLSNGTGATGANGQFTSTLRSTRAEVKTITATVEGTPQAQRPTVTFVPGPATALAFVAQPPASLTAGQTMPAVSVEVLDAQGNRVTGFTGAMNIALVAANGATLSGTTAQAVATGLASFSDLIIQRAGAGYQLRATVAGPLGPIEVLSTAFNVVADTQSPLSPTLDVSKNTVTADGVDFTTVTVTVVDRFSNPVENQAVNVAATGTGNTLTPSGGSTNASGQFTATLRSTRAEVKTVSATLNGTPLAQTRSVTFVSGPPVSLAFVTQPPSSLTAGSVMSAVQVQLLDAQGNRVTNSTDTVELVLDDPSGGGATLDGTVARAAVAGLATFDDLFIERAGVDYTLLAGTPLAGVTGAVSDAFAVTASTPTTTNSTLLAVPATVVADNVREATLTVTVRDAYNNPVEAQGVTLAVSGVANTLDRSSGVSGVNGLFVARLKSSKAEVKTITATVNGQALAPATVTFVAGEVASLSLIAVPSEVEANGVDGATLTATAEDVFGNRVPGANVTFTATGSNNVFDPGDGPTDAGGQRVTALRSTTFGVRTVNATIVTGAGNKVGTTVVTFLRPSAQVSNVVLPVSPAAGCTTLQYTVSHSQSSRVDIAVEYEEGGVFKRATQAGADTGSGVQSVATSPTGVTHVFHWNSTADLPASNTTLRVRVTARLAGALPNSSILNGVTLGNGLRFADAGLMSAGTAPMHVGRADLNGDGRVDLVVASPSSPSLQLLLGDGVGSFAFPIPVNVGVGAAALLVRDLDHDGKADALVGSAGGPEVLFLKGTGTGGFAAPVTAATLQGIPAGLNAGDFNRDSKVDLAATSTAGTVEVALATTPGVFAAPVRTNVGGSPGAITVADFNLDARVDIAFGDAGDDVKRMLGDGTGGFGAVTPLGMGTGTVVLAVADLNVDGRPDLVAARGASGVVSVARGNGDGTFAIQPAINTGGQPSSVAVADMDVDGRRDVVVSGVGDDVLVLRGELDGSVSSTPLVVPAGGPLAGLVVLDADRSSRLDVAAARPGANGVAVLLNTQVDRCERTLGAGMQLAVTTQPSAVALSDLDKDGRLDLVAAAGGSNTLNIARGRGNGTFSAFTAVPLGAGATNPQGVTTGDFNNDGRTDLVSANLGTNNVSLLLDNGGGGFTSSTWSTGTAPRGVAAADFDQDGNLDLVVANSTASSVTVLYGNGDGTFSFTLTPAVGSAPQSVVAADLNGDGCPDIAAANSSGGNVTPLRADRNAGTGVCQRAFIRLANASVGTSPRAITAADFNADNKLDLVVVNANSNSVSVLPGVGDGSFTAPVNTAATGSNPEFRDPRGLAVGDFNLDGKLDVATGNFLGNSITVLYGNGTGPNIVPFLIGPTAAAGSGVTSLLGADLDGDGKQDLVGTLTADNRVAVLRGTGTGIAGASLFPALTTPGSTATALGATVADVNKDGKPDLLVADRSAAKMSLLLGDGTGNFAPAISPTVGTNPTAVHVSDVNRDGNPDVLVANSVTNNVTILLGDGNGGLSGTTLPSGGGLKGVSTEDLDRDGDLDIITVGTGVHTHVNNGGTFGTTVSTSSGGTPQGLVTADFNSDGRPDVATVNLSGGTTVGVLLGTGTGGFVTPAKTTGLGSSGTAIAAGDLDRDGKLDLAVAIGNAPNYEVRALKGVGDGTFTAMATMTLTVATPGADGLSIGDIDGDGRLDIIASLPATDNVVVWRGNGNGGFSPAVFWSSADTTQSVALADLNSDGLLDIVTGGITLLGVLLGR